MLMLNLVISPSAGQPTSPVFYGKLNLAVLLENDGVTIFMTIIKINGRPEISVNTWRN
jgi:hypothetical protein